MATEEKPKKRVGLAAKAKRRKQVSESRLAQRTGMSQEKRDLLKAEKELFGIPKMTADQWKKFWKLHGAKKGGKLAHGGKAKKKYGVVGKPRMLKKGGKA